MQVEDEILEPEEPEPTPTPSPDRLTRKQVAERLGVSLSKVRTMEGKELHPTRENGVNYFAVGEIDALVRADAAPTRTKGGLTDGQLAARVFRLLDAGKNLRAIVTERRSRPTGFA